MAKTYFAYHQDLEVMTIYHSELGAAALHHDDVLDTIGYSHMVESETGGDPVYARTVMVEVDTDLSDYELTADDKKKLIQFAHQNDLFI